GLRRLIGAEDVHHAQRPRGRGGVEPRPDPSARAGVLGVPDHRCRGESALHRGSRALTMPTSSDYDEGTGLSAPLELALERNVQAPAIARAAISGLCEDLRLDGPVRQTLVLLISEVVSNAVLHSSGPAEAPI